MQRRIGSIVVSALLVVGFLWTTTIKDAHAYIDMGSGSLMIQMLFATLFGSLFALKLYWQRFTSRVSRILAKIKGQKDSA